MRSPLSPTSNDYKRSHNIRLTLLTALTVLSIQPLRAFADLPPIQVTATAQQSSARIGDAILIRFTLQNTSLQTIEFFETAPACDYIVEVKRDGKENAPPSKYMQEVRCDAQGPTGRNIHVVLKPGDTYKDGLNLTEFVVITQPGSYRIRIGRAMAKKYGGATVFSDPIYVYLSPPAP